MRLFVAITDSDWFDYLSELRPDEVNFWKPSGAKSFHSLSPGEPLLFKLHSPDNFIVGGGFFSHYTVLPANFAWGAFGEKNGAETETEMRRLIENRRKRMGMVSFLILLRFIVNVPSQWPQLRPARSATFLHVSSMCPSTPPPYDLRVGCGAEGNTSRLWLLFCRILRLSRSERGTLTKRISYDLGVYLGSVFAVTLIRERR
jgi:hypothetical protein